MRLRQNPRSVSVARRPEYRDASEETEPVWIGLQHPADRVACNDEPLICIPPHHRRARSVSRSPDLRCCATPTTTPITKRRDTPRRPLASFTVSHSGPDRPHSPLARVGRSLSLPPPRAPRVARDAAESVEPCCAEFSQSQRPLGDTADHCSTCWWRWGCFGWDISRLT
jgi:hypothetical protein